MISQKAFSDYFTVLKLILHVKLNLDYTCEEFYDILNKNTGLLKQIASQEKYDFKKKDNEHESENDKSADLNMSIE